MINVLFIARYRDPTMHRKVALLSQQPDLKLWYIYPRTWQDELIAVDQSTPVLENIQAHAIPMIGRVTDPHRALYRTLTFSLPRIRPDIIHAEEEPDSLSALQIVLARRLLAPHARLLLFNWQNVNRPKAWPVRWVIQRTLDASDSIMCANQAGVALMRQYGYRKHTTVLPAIGVDTTMFTPCADATSHAGTFVVGYVGRIVAEKGIDTLVEAIAHLVQQAQPDWPRIQLVILGNGTYRAALEALVREKQLQPHVTFLAAMPPAQVARQMGQLDVLVLPSRSTAVWEEQLGRVLLEAMACKVAVIGSSSGAIPEVIGDAGLIFSEGDVSELAACLQQLIDSPTLRHDYVERGYQRAMRLYTQAHIAACTADHYRWMMQQSHMR